MNIRIENIECRFTHDQYQIVKWYPNTYYGAEENLFKEGYEKIDYKDGSFGITKDHHTIHSSCFVNKESCYAVATLEYDEDERCVNMKTVDSRLLNLKKKERKAFFQVYKLADQAIRLQNKKKK